MSGYWSFAGWLCDCDMRIWEVIRRHSYMNLTRAFVSSTIDRPHLPESHLKVTKTHFSCQSLFREPRGTESGPCILIWDFLLVFAPIYSIFTLFLPLILLQHMWVINKMSGFTCTLYTGYWTHLFYKFKAGMYFSLMCSIEITNQLYSNYFYMLLTPYSFCAHN